MTEKGVSFVSAPHCPELVPTPEHPEPVRTGLSHVTPAFFVSFPTEAVKISVGATGGTAVGLLSSTDRTLPGVVRVIVMGFGLLPPPQPNKITRVKHARK